MPTSTGCVTETWSIGKRRAKERNRWAGRRSFDPALRLAVPYSKRPLIPPSAPRRPRDGHASRLPQPRRHLRPTSFCSAYLIHPSESSAISPFASLFPPGLIANSALFRTRYSSFITCYGLCGSQLRSEDGSLPQASKGSGACSAASACGDGRTGERQIASQFDVEAAVRCKSKLKRYCPVRLLPSLGV